MAKLIFLLDGNVMKEYILDKERMTIGRRASNDIYIDNLAISGEHAVLVTADENTYLEDLNSTNGTLVNKKPVRKQALTHGDEIGLGKYTLKYLKNGVANTAQSNGFSDTVMVQPEVEATDEGRSNAHVLAEVEPPLNQMPEELEAQSSQPESEQNNVEQNDVVQDDTAIAEQAASGASATAEANTQAQEPRLQILNGESAGGALSLDKTMVKVGTQGEQVAVVTKRQDGYFITHVAGDKYPVINGEQVGAQAIALKNHDEIEVLGVVMEFRFD